jgi:hypothetical protein
MRKRDREGYFMLDHRHAGAPQPGEWQVRAGLPPESGKGLWESATMKCAHCGTIVIMNPDRSRSRGYCRRCDSYVCDSPGCNSHCYPVKQRMEDALAAASTGRRLPVFK